MNCYFQPVNLKHWNIFEKVKNIGHIEVFLATKEMQIGDIMLLHIGNQVKKYEAGVYAWGVIVTRPYVLKDKPQDYCNNRLSVDVKILGIDYEKPFIKTSEHKIFKQYRTVHKLQDKTFKLVEELLPDNFGDTKNSK